MDGHVRMNIGRQLKNIDMGCEVVASYPEFKHLPIIIGESDPEGCAACSVATHPSNAYRNGTMYSSYSANTWARTYEIARKHGVNIVGAVAWAFEHITEYGGDPKRIFVAGMSAGSYLSMMVGMDAFWLAAHGISNRALAGIGALSGQATKHFAVREYAGDKDPQYLPKIDRLAPLAHASPDIPPILSVCGEPPWEWPGRSEENRLLIGSCVALGHPYARFVQCAYCDHGRTYPAALPFLEMFVHGELP